MAKYVIGIDYGTLSARALVCEVGTGRELGEGVFEYPHAVMDECLPDGTVLPPDWALEHPQDYLDALYAAVPEALKNAGVDKDDVIGLGIDFTACTLMPIDKNGDPLSDKYPSRPHAYVKLWKHHAAQEQANRLNHIAEERGEKWLKRYGGKISSEWMFPKLMQTAEEDPELFKEADRFIEAGDWV
ncbi:MAG: ribulokinase, partial [Clostridia bacterium]|nr:ribulokinase [Clostridia bacterium]